MTNAQRSHLAKKLKFHPTSTASYDFEKNIWKISTAVVIISSFYWFRVFADRVFTYTSISMDASTTFLKRMRFDRNGLRKNDDPPFVRDNCEAINFPIAASSMIKT